MDQILYIPVGIPGAGKSTYGKYIEDVIAVSTDEIRRILTGDPTNQNKNLQVFSTFYNDISKNLSLGCDVYADATNLDARSRKSLRLLANAWGAQTELILFTNVDKARSRNRYRPTQVPEYVMDRMVSKLVDAREAIATEIYDNVVVLED